MASVLAPQLCVIFCNITVSLLHNVLKAAVNVFFMCRTNTFHTTSEAKILAGVVQNNIDEEVRWYDHGANNN